MIKLNSFSDLEVPVGLFPLEVSFYLESTASRIVNYLAGLSLKEVNQSLVFIRSMMRRMYQMSNDDEVSQSFSSIIKRQLNRDDRFIPPEKEIASDALMMQMLDQAFLCNTDKFLREDVNSNETVKNVLEGYKKSYGTASLYYYLLGINIGRREKRKNTSENNEFYRLGKSSQYFFASNFTLSIVSHMQSEVSAITQKEKQIKEKRKESASKGGKKRVSKYSLLKDKIFHLYNEKYSKHSNRNAAIRICKDFDKEDLSILTTPYPEETIAKWISQYKKLKEK